MRKMARKQNGITRPWHKGLRHGSFDIICLFLQLNFESVFGGRSVFAGKTEVPDDKYMFSELPHYPRCTIQALMFFAVKVKHLVLKRSQQVLGSACTISHLTLRTALSVHVCLH